MFKFMALTVISLGFLGCANPPKIDPEQCERLTKVAHKLSVTITKLIDEEKVAKVQEYEGLVANLAAIGCAFIPLEETEK